MKKIILFLIFTTSFDIISLKKDLHSCLNPALRRLRSVKEKDESCPLNFKMAQSILNNISDNNPHLDSAIKAVAMHFLFNLIGNDQLKKTNSYFRLLHNTVENLTFQQTIL